MTINGSTQVYIESLVPVHCVHHKSHMDCLGIKARLGGEKLVTVLWHGLIPGYAYQHSPVFNRIFAIVCW